MGHRLKSSSSFVTALLVGVMVTLLLGIIVITQLFAPDKPPPPPVSIVKYEAPPSLEELSYQFNAMNAVDIEDPNAEIDLPYKPRENEHLIRGVITNAETGKGIVKARITAIWELTEEEKAEHQAILDSALELESEERWKAINAADHKYRKENGSRSYRGGEYEIYIPKDRPVSLRFGAQGFLTSAFDELEFDFSAPYSQFDVALDVGALISGRITEEGTGKPIMDMRINILRINRYGDAVHTGINYNYDYKTNTDGVYSIYGLLPGKYEVGAYFNGTRYQEGEVLPYTQVELTHANQKLTNVDFQLGRAGVVWGYIIDPDTGQGTNANLILVTSENIVTQGINAAFSAMMNQEEPDFYGSSSLARRQGYYEIAGVPYNKEFRVYATSSGKAAQLSEPFILTSYEPDIRVDINMFRGSNLSGRVVDENYNPVHNAEVTVIPSFTELFSPLSSSKAMDDDRTDEDGYFLLESIPQGNYQLFAFKEGFKYSARGIPAFPNGIDDIDGLTIQLEHVDSGEHLIYGTVVDTRGNPIPDAKLQLGGVSTTDITGVEMTTEADMKGDFVFEGMSIGKYLLHVSAEGGYASRNVVNVYLDKPNIIELEAGALFRGTVLVKETGRPPAAGTRITAKPKFEFSEGLLSALENANFDSGYTSVEDQSGQFEMSLNAGEYVIQASRDGFIDGQITVKLRPDQIKSGTVYLSQTGGTIEGIVRTRDNRSPQGARVILQRVSKEANNSLLENLSNVEDLFTGKSVRVAADGKFVFENLPSGHYIAYAQHKNYANGHSDTIPLSASSSVTGVAVWLTSGGSIEGYVTQNGRVASNTVVMLLSTTSPISTSTDSNGFYFFDGVAPGEHHVQVVGASVLGNLNDITELSDALTGDPVVVREGQVTRFDIRQ